MRIVGWKKLFAPHILSRGEDYYESELVEIEAMDEESIEAAVEGTDTYSVEIVLKNNRVAQMRCDCPYAADGNNCKHMAAGLFAADDAERDVISLKKAEYMSQHIGDVFEGVLSGMNNYGLFAELENTCEGVIRYDSMDDYYELDPSGCFVTGVGKGKVYSLGDKVRIRVKSVDLQAKTVYF